MQSVDRRQLAAAAVLLATGIVFGVGSIEMRIGTARQMGAGFFPLAFSAITVALSLLIGAQALFRSGGLPLPPWRPFAAIVASVAGFALVVPWLGLLPAIFCTVVVAALADRRSTPLGTLLLAAVLALLGWLVFVRGLGMPLPVFRSPF